MKITLIAGNFSSATEAAADGIFAAATDWADWGHEVCVITAPAVALPVQFDHEFGEGRRHPQPCGGLEVIAVRARGARNPARPWRWFDGAVIVVGVLVAGCSGSRPDVVVATTTPALGAIAGWIVAVRHRRPLVLVERRAAGGARSQPPPPGLCRLFERWVYREAATVVAVSGAAKKALIRRGIPADKIAVVREDAGVKAGDGPERRVTPAAGGLAPVAGRGRRRQAEATLQALEMAVAGCGGQAGQGSTAW
ncbi:MAG: glycosyltransferase [Azospirillum sp.]|nr:glycosyltransferase [Azospirillum sp.]